MAWLKGSLDDRRPDGERELEVEPIEVGLALASRLPRQTQQTGAAIDRLASGDGRQKVPLRQGNRVAGLRMQVEPFNDASGDQPWLRALQPRSRCIQLKLKPRAAEGMIGAEEGERRDMKDPYLLLRRGALCDELDALVPVAEQSQLHSVAGVRDVGGRDDVRGHRQVEAIRERLPVGVAGEVIDVGGEPRPVGEVVASREQNFLAALVLRGGPAVEHLRVVRGGKVRPRPAKVEGCVLGKTDARVILRAYREVGRAVEYHVYRFTDDNALGARLAEGGDQQARLALVRVRRMRDIRQKQYRHIQQAKGRVTASRFVVVDRKMCAGELPVRLGQLARGDRAVIDVITSRAGFDHHAPRKQKWIAVAVYRMQGRLRHLDAHRPGHIEEPSGLRLQVEGTARGLHPLVVVTALG